jgi:hypothetical protein
MPKTLHICKGAELMVGDTLVFKNIYYSVLHIEDEQYGRSVCLVDNSGDKRVRFVTNDEIITIEL